MLQIKSAKDLEFNIIKYNIIMHNIKYAYKFVWFLSIFWKITQSTIYGVQVKFGYMHGWHILWPIFEMVLKFIWMGLKTENNEKFLKLS